MKSLIVVALVALAVPASSAATAGDHSVDLALGMVDGKSPLGLTVGEVRAAFGKPDFATGNQRTFRIGWGSPANFTMEVLFRRSGGRLRAGTIVFERGTVVDAKVGRLLEQRPRDLQAKVRRAYGDVFKLARPYKCVQARCVGVLAAKAGRIHLTFGSTAARGTFLTIWEGRSA
jgi:hypothetical protein